MSARRSTGGRSPAPAPDSRGALAVLAGSAGPGAPAALLPLAGETIVHKSGFDGFARGGLDAALERARCAEAIVAGLHPHACVRAVVAGCLDRGLPVIVADDAVASNDPICASCTRRWLAERCVRFLSVQATLSRLDGVPPSGLVHRSPRRLDAHWPTVRFGLRRRLPAIAPGPRAASRPVRAGRTPAQGSTAHHRLPPRRCRR